MIRVYLKNNPKSYRIHKKINVFLNILAEENFDINIGMARKYISFNVVISNLVSLTPLKNTDLYLEIIRKHKNWFLVY